MAGIAGEFLLKLYLVILVSGKLALSGWLVRSPNIVIPNKVMLFLHFADSLRNKTKGNNFREFLVFLIIA